MTDTVLETLAQTSQRLLFGLRTGVLVIASAVLATASLFRNIGAYNPLWTQLAAFGIDLGIIAVEFVLIIRRRSWSRARWLGVGLAYLVAAMSGATLPHDAPTTALDWIYGTTGWIGLLLLLDLPIGWLAGFLIIHESITVIGLIAHSPDKMTVLNAVVAAVGAIGLPFGTGLGATALRSIARSSHQSAAESEHIRTTEAVAAALHERRQERFTALYESVVPVLEGLAAGALDPDDRDVQRTCSIEAARMRRLFAETDDVANPLRHELVHCADIADRRGVVVDLETHGSWPQPPLRVRRALTEAPLAVLATASTWARVTVVGTDDVVSVNVVADCGPIDLPGVDRDLVTLERVNDGKVLWVEVKWQADRSQQS